MTGPKPYICQVDSDGEVSITSLRDFNEKAEEKFRNGEFDHTDIANLVEA